MKHDGTHELKGPTLYIGPDRRPNHWRDIPGGQLKAYPSVSNQLSPDGESPGRLQYYPMFHRKVLFRGRSGTLWYWNASLIQLDHRLVNALLPYPALQLPLGTIRLDVACNAHDLHFEGSGKI